MKRVLLLTLVSMLLVGCQYDPHAHLYTTIEPKKEDLVGLYFLDRFDLPAEITGMPSDIEVELHADGTFKAKNVPRWTLDIADPSLPKTLISGEGRWEKSSMGVIEPGSKRTWGVYLRTPDDRFHPANFTGQKPPYGLIFGLGDPDSGHAILLKRKEPNQTPEPTAPSGRGSS